MPTVGLLHFCKLLVLIEAKLRRQVVSSLQMKLSVFTTVLTHLGIKEERMDVDQLHRKWESL